MVDSVCELVSKPEKEQAVEQNTSLIQNLNYSHPWPQTVLDDQGLPLNVEKVDVSFKLHRHNIVDKQNDRNRWAYEGVKSDVTE
mgnify:CR=1 FL=1